MLKTYLRLLKQPFSTYSTRMYQLWKQNPSNVHPQWRNYFGSLNSQPKQFVQPSNIPVNKNLQKEKDLALRAYLLVRYYKTNGHQNSNIDPLELQNFAQFGKVYAKHKLQASLAKNNVLKKEDLDIPFQFPKSQFINKNIAHFLKDKQTWTLRQIKNKLQTIYCGKLGVEFMYLSNHEQKQWIMNEIQKISQAKISKNQKIKIFHELTKIEAFNSFLFSKIKTSKRFGVQGLDTMISGLNHLVEEAAQKQIKFVGFGMAHRGRVNTLANVFQKPLQRIFAQYQENMINQTSWGLSGDVNYHLGSAITRQVNDKKIRLSILPNPSHLETVNAVAMGHVKAYSDSLHTQGKSLCVVIHGDAAMAGQGVTYEALQMSYLPHYNTRGVIHVVANNQIGFTTTPAQARTGLYCTDVAKAIQAPVIHVNADEPQLVHKAMSLALQYREKFQKDIFVDVVGYRRYGHNQLDQPVFTQPMMYKKISQRPTIYSLYTQKLISQNIITQDEVKRIWQQQIQKLKIAYDEALHESFDVRKLFFQNYHKFPVISQLGSVHNTGVTLNGLKYIGNLITKIPQTFSINPQINKIYQARRSSIQTGEGIDFGTAEALAFGSLLQQGFNVRLSGQDVERGTFSHRHAVIVDQKSQQKYMPLQNLLSLQEKNRVQIQNSLLSQYGALAFEYGYSLTKLNTLTIWEAQFGDFANGAQIMIDDYLASGQNKWNIETGLVLNLPHGMDGQGPEHSSCRIERFLQLVNDGWANLQKQEALRSFNDQMKKCNLQVVCCSTSANLFHAYRRQVRRQLRKPLINIVNKKLLKNREASSNLQQLVRNNFLTVIGQVDQIIKPEDVKKVIITYGQAYYAAVQKRRQLNRKDVAIVRVQQLAPFDYGSFSEIIEKYENAKDFIWFQEEHRNAGPWGYLGPRISLVLEWLKEDRKIKQFSFDVCSRKVSSSPAVGKKKRHDEQQQALLSKLFE